MIRVVSFLLMLSLADANRLSTHEIAQSEVTSKFFENCDDLQGIFRGRVAAVQSLVDAHPAAMGLSKMDQARFTMRMFAVVRTLRRAKDCAWVVDGDREDVQAAQAIVQVTLAGNPCAAAAMAELTPEAYEAAAHELVPLQRAMLVLVSDTCVVAELEEMDVPDAQAGVEAAQERDEQMTNTIDELFEQASTESTGAPASLVQSESLLQSIFAWVGAIFFAIAFGLACAVPSYFMGLLIGIMLASGWCSCCSSSPGCQEAAPIIVFSALGSMPLGFAICAAQPILSVASSGGSDFPQ